MGGWERVWEQPARIVVREGYFRHYYEIPDDQPLPNGQQLQDMVGELLLCGDPMLVEFDEAFAEVEPEPYPESGRCVCGHWMEADSPTEGHTRRYGDKCLTRGCGCPAPRQEPEPPWVSQTPPWEAPSEDVQPASRDHGTGRRLS